LSEDSPKLDLIGVFLDEVELLVRKDFPKIEVIKDKTYNHKSVSFVAVYAPYRLLVKVAVIENLFSVVAKPDDLEGDVLVGTAQSPADNLSRDRKLGNLHDPNLSARLVTIVVVEHITSLRRENRKSQHESKELWRGNI
jgi:hypothetical protein